MDMITVQQITEVDKLLKLWPRLFKLILVEQPQAKAELTLAGFLNCLQHGAVFVVKEDIGVTGSSCVEVVGDDNNTAILHSLPKNGNGGNGRLCLTHIKVWAKANGLTTIKASTNKLNGSSYRYFEDTLGFRRNTVTFSLKVS